jgi:hypothetical protein
MIKLSLCYTSLSPQRERDRVRGENIIEEYQ